MRDRLMSLLPSRALATLRALTARAPVQEAPTPTILPGLDTRPAPMRPLLPPAATNDDDPLQAIHEAVERELRASGHLR